MNNDTMRDKLEELILSSYEGLYRMAFTYMHHEQDAMDVVQETIVKALKNVHQVKEESFLKTWLCRILIHTAIDELARRKKVLPLLKEPEEGREDTYKDTDTHKLLEHLNETERAVVILRYFEEWKLEEIAALTEKNVNTIKSILYRSLKKLKTELRGEERCHER